jgi:hypothetical protein
MNKNNFLLVLILIFTLSIYFSGCGKKEDTSSVEKKEDVKPEEQKKITEGKTNELGITEGLPKDYPSDIPQPKNSKCMGSLNTSEGTVVTFESDNRPKDVLSEFTSALEKSGYKKGEGEMMSDEGGLSMWTKNNKEVSLMLAWDKDKSKSSVVVTYK